MRNGDVYKIKRLTQKEGATVEDILARFKNDYPEKEIRRFIPAGTKTNAQKESGSVDKVEDKDTPNEGTVDWIKLQLREKGISFEEGLLKADLQKLLDEANNQQDPLG